MRPVKRQLSVYSVLLATSTLLAACGSSSHPATTATAHAGTVVQASTAPGASLTKAQARAFARAVNLRAQDLPGFKVSPPEHEHETSAEKQQGHAFLRCVGSVAFKRALFEAGSKDFERQTNTSTESVHSDVEVARTPALAAEELAAAHSEHARACLSNFLQQLLGAQGHTEGGTVGPVSVEVFTPSAPATAGSFGWRISTTFSLHGIQVPARFDILGFGYRTALVILLHSGFPQPPASSQEQSLLSLLISRAQSFPR
jgi:hypothetical protein